MLKKSLISESHPEITSVKVRLDHFYENAQKYDAFESSSQHPEAWKHVIGRIKELKVKLSQVRVLEAGSGRTGFPQYVHDLRHAIHFTAQDITSQNKSFLNEVSDSVHIGRLQDLTGPYDIIFSTYAWEHMTEPLSTLRHWLSILAPGGSLFIFSPRYDFPGYLSPSSDHLNGRDKFTMRVILLLLRMKAWFSCRPAFLIHSDPALFHLPWKRDRDAVHWVSLLDIQLSLGSEYSVRRLSLASGGIKDWIVKNCLTLSVEIRSLK